MDRYFSGITLIAFAALCGSCTLSFQNVNTYGTASDVVDTDPETDADADFKFPVL